MIGIAKYVGQPWEPTRDCWWWFRKIQTDEFGRDVTSAMVNHSSWIALIKSAADIMEGDIEDRFGWRQTVTPATGDAVFMSLRQHPHHIGTAIIDQGRLHVLHALEGAGVVYDSRVTLRTHGWRIHGFWTPMNES